MFALVAEAIGKLLPVEKIRYVAFSHVEADEFGALNDCLATAPGAVLRTGSHVLRWFDAPHVPHAGECGFMLETETRTLLCGDLFTQGGDGATPVTESDILGPSEAFRSPMNYYAHALHTGTVLERLARERPQVHECACTAALGGATMLRALAQALGARTVAAAA